MKTTWHFPSRPVVQKYSNYEVYRECFILFIAECLFSSHGCERTTEMDRSTTSLFGIECRECCKYRCSMILRGWCSVSCSTLHHYPSQKRNRITLRRQLVLRETHRFDLRTDAFQSRRLKRAASRNLIGWLHRLTHRQQTLKELKEVIHCVEINQREFVDAIDVGQRSMFVSDGVMFFSSDHAGWYSHSFPVQSTFVLRVTEEDRFHRRRCCSSVRFLARVSARWRIV